MVSVLKAIVSAMILVSGKVLYAKLKTNAVA